MQIQKPVREENCIQTHPPRKLRGKTAYNNAHAGTAGMLRIAVRKLSLGPARQFEGPPRFAAGLLLIACCGRSLRGAEGPHYVHVLAQRPWPQSQLRHGLTLNKIGGGSCITMWIVRSI